MMVWGKRMCESIKCTPYCGMLKVMGREVPIGDLIIVSQWEIIHWNEMRWKGMKASARIPTQWKGFSFKTIIDKGQWYKLKTTTE